MRAGFGFLILLITGAAQAQGPQPAPVCTFSYATASLAIFTAMPYLSCSDKAKIDSTVRTLQAAGAWSALDSLYVLAAPSALAAAVDWVKPSRTLTVNGSPIFTPNAGYTGDGATGYLDTNYNPSTNAINLSQNAATLGVWSLTSLTEGSGVWLFGQPSFSIAPFGNGHNSYFSRNASGTNSISYDANAGLYTSARTLSTGFNLYQNGALFASVTKSSNGANIFGAGQEQQGWTTDGSFYYTTATTSLVQRNLATWASIQANASPFTSLTSADHMGAPTYANSKIFAPATLWSGSCAGTNSPNYVAAYATSNLALSTPAAVTATMNTVHGNISGLAADTDHNVLYGSDFCDTTIIYRFDLTTLAQLSSIQLASNPVSTSYQGVAYSNGLLYVTANSGNAAAQPYVLVYDLSGNNVANYYLSDLPANREGIAFSGASFGVAYDDGVSAAAVYFYSIPTGQTITQASAAITSGNFYILSRNGSGTFDTNQVAAAFVGGAMTSAQIGAVNAALATYLHAVGAN